MGVDTHDVYGFLGDVYGFSNAFYEEGNPYTSWLLCKTMYMDFPFVKCMGDPYASWGFCGGPTGDFHIHRG